MSKDEKSIINNQKIEVFEKEQFVNLHSACSIGNGILKLDEEYQNRLIQLFFDEQPRFSFFIPASGSGSRMFNFLFNHESTPHNSNEINTFVKNLSKFAFYSLIPSDEREKMKDDDPKHIADFLLSSGGMNFSNLPKGLIPFHFVDGVIYNPFQEQVAQANDLMLKRGEIHFTIQEGFEKIVQRSINELSPLKKSKLKVSCSNQKSVTDAYCFDNDQNELIEEGGYLRRPAGHGALIQNLNLIDDDVVLIKNIDNVQHYSRSEHSNATWRMLMGLLLEFKKDLRKLRTSYSQEGIYELNRKYDFLSDSELKQFDASDLERIISRPSRVCGMVKNEGGPGGGPFWVRDKDQITKQIVEGVEISEVEDQKNVFRDSSHFNPVLMVISKTDLDGGALNLTDYVDDKKSIIVKKMYRGEEINYLELPGLWNGSMSNWNSIFVEVSIDVFSPVKTALDLLSNAHKD